jgi:hypothetical protein
MISKKLFIVSSKVMFQVHVVVKECGYMAYVSN